jgi:glycosyltransferase involved in cell wall biosynthesis
MGGAEVFTREVAKRLFERGNEVTLFTSAYAGCPKQEVSEGVEIVRSGGRYSVYWSARRFYAKQVKHNNFDVVVDEINTIPFFTPQYVKSDELIVSLIHQLAREYWFYETKFPLSYIGYHFLENAWLKNYVDTPVITVSESSRQDLISLGFKNISVAHGGVNFVPLSELAEKSECPIIVFSGRLKAAKRPDHLIKAFKIVKHQFPSAQLWIIGDGSYKKVLEKISFDGVKFFGGLSNGDRRELIKRSHVLVNPSVREGWPLNVIEANALGVPAVCYDVNGLRDSVRNNETGVLAQPGDISDLAAKIIFLLKNKSFREKLSQNAMVYSRSFNWDKTADGFLNVVEKNL